MKADATPWPIMLSAALRLGLAPAEFWRLSLKEWRALTMPVADDTLNRAAFAVLAQSFPDELT